MHVGMVAIGAMGQGVNTALGDAVNMAFRIEALTRVVDRSTLVSAAFLEGWEEGRSQFKSCGLHQIKGQADLIEVFAPRPVKRVSLGRLIPAREMAAASLATWRQQQISGRAV